MLLARWRKQFAVYPV